MTEPTTVNIGLIVPNTGDLVGTWGSAAVNPNMSAVDGHQAGLQTVSLTNAPVTLTGPAGFSPTPSPGPTQQENAVIRFSGTLTGNCAITFTLPGFYIVENLCSAVGTYYVQLVSAGAGNAIGAIPGKKCHVFHDGTNLDYVNMPDTGTAYDLHGWTTYPPWMLACTIAPYLIKDGTIYNNSDYPNLLNAIGNVYGGNPGLTFGVPDERNRMRVPIDTNTNGGFTNRITAAGSGINGQSFNAAGGAQNQTIAKAGLPNNTISIPAGQGLHQHTFPMYGNGGGPAAGGNSAEGVLPLPTSNPLTSTSTLPAMVTSSMNGGVTQTPTTTVPPALISFLALIKT